MFSKRLAGMVSTARAYVVADVVLQWIALVANIAIMLLIGLFAQALVEGGDVAASQLNLAWAAVAAIAVRVGCLTLAQRMSRAAAASAKGTVRKLVYDKLVRLGPSYSEHVATSEAVQVSVEGTEQLETYFGSYLPQLFYSVVAPITLFGVTLSPKKSTAQRKVHRKSTPRHAYAVISSNSRNTCCHTSAKKKTQNRLVPKRSRKPEERTGKLEPVFRKIPESEKTKYPLCKMRKRRDGRDIRC